MYYPEAVYKLNISKKLEAESESEGTISPVQTIPNLYPETYDGLVLKYANGRFVDWRNLKISNGGSIDISHSKIEPQLIGAFNHLSEEILETKIHDPSNINNIISNDLSIEQKHRIKNLA